MTRQLSQTHVISLLSKQRAMRFKWNPMSWRFVYSFATSIRLDVGSFFTRMNEILCGYDCSLCQHIPHDCAWTRSLHRKLLYFVWANITVWRVVNKYWCTHWNDCYSMFGLAQKYMYRPHAGKPGNFIGNIENHWVETFDLAHNYAMRMQAHTPNYSLCSTAYCNATTQLITVVAFFTVNCAPQP